MNGGGMTQHTLAEEQWVDLLNDRESFEFQQQMK